MADGTGISWTDATWNTIRGCSRVSEGCRHCYAETVAGRFCGPGQPYEGLAKVRPSGERVWTGDVRMVAEHLADPLRWRKPRRIFVNSMSDLFHEKLTNEQIAAVFGVMAAAPQHTFQVLTKRARRMREWFEWLEGKAGCTTARLGFLIGEAVNLLPSVPPAPRGNPHGPTGTTWPLPNVWLGVSVENQAAADERIPELCDSPAAVRFLSCEPLLGEVSVTSYLRGSAAFKAIAGYAGKNENDEPGIDWVIAGCESGPGARPCDVAWLRLLRDQCAAAGVAFFLKQAKPGAGSLAYDAPKPAPIAPGDGAKWKPGAVIELPYLDDVQHAEFPERVP